MKGEDVTSRDKGRTSREEGGHGVYILVTTHAQMTSLKKCWDTNPGTRAYTHRMHLPLTEAVASERKCSRASPSTTACQSECNDDDE